MGRGPSLLRLFLFRKDITILGPLNQVRLQVAYIEVGIGMATVAPSIVPMLLTVESVAAGRDRPFTSEYGGHGSQAASYNYYDNELDEPTLLLRGRRALRPHG